LFQYLARIKDSQFLAFGKKERKKMAFRSNLNEILEVLVFTMTPM
jgi:hypothetical protein